MPFLLLLLLAPIPWIGLPHGLSVGWYISLTLVATLILYTRSSYYRRNRVELSRRYILGWALILRLVLLPMSPSLSDDAWRYLWDGRLLVEGISPYHAVPADSSLNHLRDELFRLQAYPTTNTIYPPGAQILFATAMAQSTFLGGDYMAGYYLYKGMLVALELVAVAMLLELRRLRSDPCTPAVLYAWHPLAIVELAGQGHTDALWVAAIGLALVAFASNGWGRGIPWLALGGTLRLYPLALIPIWLPFTGWRHWWRGILLSVPFLALLAVFLDPIARDTFTTVLARFTNYYEFNGGVYYGVKWLADALSLKPSNRIAGAICTGLMLLCHVGVLVRYRHGGDVAVLASAILALLTAEIALGAKAHVWYFTAPLYVAAALDAGPLRRGWFWLALFAPVTYAMYLVQPITERMEVVAVEWSLFALVTGSELARLARKKYRSPDGNIAACQPRQSKGRKP